MSDKEESPPDDVAGPNEPHARETRRSPRVSWWKPLGLRLRVRERWAVIAIAIPTWALALAFWLQDAIDPLTAPALLLDRTFQVLTLVLIPASFLIVTAKPRLTLYSIVFTGAVGAMLGAAITLSGVIRPPHDFGAVALAVVALLTGAWLAARYGQRLPEFRSMPARALAFLVVSAIPLLQLWNNAAFLPSRTEATLSQSVKLEVKEVTDDAFRLTLDYEAANPTDVRVIVIVSRLTLCWWAADETPVFDDDKLRDRPECRFYRPIAQQAWVSAGISLGSSTSQAIPLDRPRVTVVARVAFARGDRLRTSEDSVTFAELGTCRDVNAVRLEEESRIKSLAERSKHLVYADRDGDGGLDYYFDSGPTIECSSRAPSGSSDSANLAEYFGVTHGRQVSDVWLTAPKSKAGD